jgi:hypothetical protein
MARGWESKSVEAQIEDNKRGLSHPGNATRPSPQQAQANRKRADLLLSRKRILEQLGSSTNERYSQMLRHSLAELDTQLGSE